MPKVLFRSTFLIGCLLMLCLALPISAQASPFSGGTVIAPDGTITLPAGATAM